MESWSAIIIGFVGGGVYYLSSKINLHLLKVLLRVNRLPTRRAGTSRMGHLPC